MSFICFVQMFLEPNIVTRQHFVNGNVKENEKRNCIENWDEKGNENGKENERVNGYENGNGKKDVTGTRTGTETGMERNENVNQNENWNWSRMGPDWVRNWYGTDRNVDGTEMNGLDRERSRKKTGTKELQ